MSGIHDGHRKRMKEQFMKNGAEVFNDHQILELLLFYSLPRIDTNPIAHELINKFGSLPAALDASYEELMKVNHITENTAVLLKLIPSISKLYGTQKASFKTPMNTKESIYEYFRHLFINDRTEVLKICLLDDELCLKECVNVETGVANTTPVSARKIAEIVFRSNSSNIILAHNHPNGKAIPSDEDVITTRKLKAVMQELGISLLDHVIVGSDTSVCSMKTAGYLDTI